MGCPRIILADDNPEMLERVAKFLSSGFDVVGLATDGQEAIESALRLSPDILVTDIAMPIFSGIQVASHLRRLGSTAKVIFLTVHEDHDYVEAAFSIGVLGYVLKPHLTSDLIPAIERALRGLPFTSQFPAPALKVVLESKRFVSASLAGHDSNAPKDDHAAAVRHCHEVAFYADDGSVVDGYARFIESALESGNAVIVVVTEAHRVSLLSRLQADGVNVPAAIEEGNYIPLDAADALSRLTVNDTPDPVRCAKVIGDLITGAAKRVRGEHGRVVVCGEIAPTLLSKGNAEGAIKLEHLWDEITRGYGVHTLCGYLLSAFPDKENSPIFEGICAEHSAVHEALGVSSERKQIPEFIGKNRNASRK